MPPQRKQNKDKIKTMAQTKLSNIGIMNVEGEANKKLMLTPELTFAWRLRDEVTMS